MGVRLQGRVHLVTSLKAFLIKCRSTNEPEELIDIFKSILKEEHPSLALDTKGKQELSKWITDYNPLKMG